MGVCIWPILEHLVSNKQEKQQLGAVSSEQWAVSSEQSNSQAVKTRARSEQPSLARQNWIVQLSFKTAVLHKWNLFLRLEPEFIDVDSQDRFSGLPLFRLCQSFLHHD